MSESTDRLIADYEAGPALLRAAVEDMTPEQLRARPVPGRWSTIEVVAHLVDSEIAYVHRMKRVIAEDRPLLIGYDESRFTARLDYQEHDAPADLALFALLRSHMAAQLRRVPAEAWDRAGVHSERGLETLRDLVRIEARHVRDHLTHVHEKRRALGLPAVG